MFDENGSAVSDCFIFVPHTPIKKGLYLCDKQFHIQPIIDLFTNNHQIFGLIKINGCGYTISNIIAVSDSLTFKVLSKYSTKLQKGHSRGGQSQNRIARLHDESHFNFITKALQDTMHAFIDPDSSLPNINGLIIAGNAIKKNNLYSRLDPRLLSITLGVITIDHSANNLQDECNILIQQFLHSKDNHILDYILTNITENYIVYGEADTNKHFITKLLKTLIIHHSIFDIHSHRQQLQLLEKCDNFGTELIIIKLDNEISHLFLDGYGGVAGIKWF